MIWTDGFVPFLLAKTALAAQKVCHSSFLFLLFDSRCVLAFVFPFNSNSQTEIVLSFLLHYQATMDFRTHIFPGNGAADELFRWDTLLVPSSISYSLFFLISRIHFSLMSDWRRTVSSKIFDTQVPSISTEQLVLARHVFCVLSRLRYNEQSRLLNYIVSLELTRLTILHAAPAIA